MSLRRVKWGPGAIFMALLSVSGPAAAGTAPAHDPGSPSALVSRAVPAPAASECGVGHPAIGAPPDGRVIARLCGAPRSPASSDGALAQASVAPADGDTSAPRPPETEAGEESGPAPPVEPPLPSTSPATEFEGSAAPAGPDLSIEEEKELISRGWQ